METVRDFIFWAPKSLQMVTAAMKLRLAAWKKSYDHPKQHIKKQNSQWIKDINVRPETIKLLEENIDRTLTDINRSKIFYDSPPRVMEIKTKINKGDLIKFESFCTTKESTNKVKRALRMEKIIPRETTDKELISKTYKQRIQFNTKKTNHPIKKSGKCT